MGFEVLTVVRIHNVVRVRTRIFWYIHGVMNVLEEHFGSVYEDHHTMEVVGPDQIVCADYLDYTVP